MISFFNRIFHSIRIRTIKVSDHFLNLNKGQKIYLDGKPYVKVKLRFVDTLDFDTTRYIDQLESLIESHKSEIENLTNVNEHFKQKIKDLQNLNINLMRESKTKNEKYDLSITDLTNNLKTNEITIAELKKAIQDSNPLIDFLKEQIVVLESKIKTKDIRIRSLEAELQYIKSSKKFNHLTKKEVEKLKKNPDKSLYSIFLKNKEIDEKDKIIRILTDKEKDYQRKIETLNKEIESLNKK